MKVTLLLIGVLCVFGCAAQNKYPNLVLPKKNPLLAFGQSPKNTFPNKPIVSLPKPKGFKLPNGNYVLAENMGDMPCIIPDMSEYPNFGGSRVYKYKGLGKMPNVPQM